ncbi:hypothetical protein [Micromonospora sp. NPDC048830]|uniref:hypothetical protein n=1 Tax=Micromonospora sp. NPDC048830 TaxID=3364257 RepID=UPI003712CBE4
MPPAPATLREVRVGGRRTGHGRHRQANSPAARARSSAPTCPSSACARRSRSSIRVFATIVAGMLAGADSIDGLDIARHGGMPSLFTSVFAPSTLGAFLRTFAHGHVRQLQAAARDTLIGLAGRAPILAGADVLTFVDIDSMLRRVYGKQKQGIGFGHTKVGGYNVYLRGYNPLLATLSTPLSAPVIAATRLRSGNAGSARGAASMIAEAITTARSCAASAATTRNRSPAKTNCYRPTGITPCSPTARSRSYRPKPSTAATRSSNRSTPT